MRLPRMRRCVRILFILVLLLFVILNMHVLVSFQPEVLSHRFRTEFGDKHSSFDQPHVQIGHNHGQINKSEDPQFVIPPNFFNTSQHHTRPTVDNENLTQIAMEIEKINADQYIHNLNRYGLRLSSESVVIVVQVHDRQEYLKILLDSLRNVKNIQDSLLIISHDVFSNDLNSLVGSVDFCPVLQMFFPHSLQLHPHDFPGEHPNDCPRNIKKEEAVKKNCNNANHPDKYGHYREAKYCQTKHHWFWKLRQVFEGVQVMRDYKGLVLLLEEDYYVTPDVITTLQMMHNLKKKDCKECKMLSAGNYDKNQNYGVNAGKVEVANWISSRHNMGMTFTRDLWNEIKKCGKEFCNFDDYNWDWTLQHLASKCIPNQVKVLKMKATRVFHMGECGVHHKGKNCAAEEKRKSVQGIIDNNRQHLFPNVVSVGSYSGLKLRDPKPNGGWGDIRDRELCLSFLHTNDTQH